MKLVAWGAGAAACPLASVGCSGRASATNGKVPRLSDHEALAWEKMGGDKVHCMLCPWECIVPDGERGNCGVRENQGGTYKTLVYARICACHIDPIEKKPLFHFLPGSRSYSIATAGCNVECQFCQNWQISQALPEQVDAMYAPPDKVAAAAKEAGCPSIACTYSEPTVFYEYMLDCAREGNRLGVKTVMISNGFIQQKPMETLCKELAAVKIDLKAFTEEFYRTYVRGRLKPVLKTLELLKKLGMHSEIVVLLIPGLNDGDEELRKMCAWVKANLGPDVPMHFSRFHPDYKMRNLARTPLRTLKKAYDIARAEGIHYVYVGNAPELGLESTFCPKCGKRLIHRYGYHIIENLITDGKCPACGTAIPGVWKAAEQESRPSA